MLSSLLQYQNLLSNFNFPEQVSLIGSSINNCKRNSLGHDIGTQNSVACFLSPGNLKQISNEEKVWLKNLSKMFKHCCTHSCCAPKLYRLQSTQKHLVPLKCLFAECDLGLGVTDTAIWAHVLLTRVPVIIPQVLKKKIHFQMKKKRAIVINCQVMVEQINLK